MSDEELLELQRCSHSEAMTATTDVLDAAGIPYRLASTTANFELASIGSGQVGEVIISVRKEQHRAARAALEEEFLKVELPADHFLHGATDEELIEVVGQEDDWSPFDVAHASRLIRERGIDFEKIERERIQYIEKLKKGKPAPRVLIVAGWLFTLLGGLFGLGIAWSLCTMKEKTSYGTFFTYDAKSRAIGHKMRLVSIVLTLLWMGGVIASRNS